MLTQDIHLVLFCLYITMMYHKDVLKYIRLE
jgi:hypothetical protein